MTRDALHAPCPACRADTLTVDWDEYEQLIPSRTYRADPTPISPADEIGCIVAGRHTYRLERTIFGGWRLSYRSSSIIHTTTAATVATIPAHRCGATYPSRLDPLIPTITTEEVPF